MLLSKKQNANGTYGRCSCKKANDFKVGDRVVMVHSTNDPDIIGHTAKVVAIREGNLTGLVQVKWDRDWGFGELITAQKFRKL